LRNIYPNIQPLASEGFNRRRAELATLLRDRWKYFAPKRLLSSARLWILPHPLFIYFILFLKYFYCFACFSVKLLDFRHVLRYRISEISSFGSLYKDPLSPEVDFTMAKSLQIDLCLRES
jgi:hypothetical protein